MTFPDPILIDIGNVGNRVGNDGAGHSVRSFVEEKYTAHWA